MVYRDGSDRARRLGARLAALCLLAAPLAGASPRGALAAPTGAAPGRDAGVALRPAAAEALGASLRFEENRGQADARARFVARGDGYVLFLTPREAVFALETPDGGVRYVRTAFAGASPAARLEGVDRLPGASAYLSRGARVAGVRAYAAVRYEGLYPGVDLVFYSSRGALEYDFVVAPGADPAAVALEVDGALARLDASGDLVLETPAGVLRQRRPALYQAAGSGRRPVAGGFAVSADGRVRLAVGDYDRSRPLVVDPVVTASTYLGGSNPDRAQAVAIDAAGSAYVAGRSFSPDFPTTAGAYDTENAGNYDAFVTRFDATGGALVYSTYVGGEAFDSAQGVAVDAAGRAHVVGYTGSTGFPTTAGAFQPDLAGGTDAFVFRLSAAGSALELSTYYGGGGPDFGNAIAVDAAGDAYVGGETLSADLPVPNAISPQPGGQNDGFVAKVLASGALASATYVGGLGDDSVNGLAVDATGLYVAGSTQAAGFPLVAPFQPLFGGDVDAFLSKMNLGMTAYVYSSYLGGAREDEAAAVAVDPAGNAYVVGETSSTNFPRVTPFQNTLGGLSDAFVTKVNAAGSAVVYSSYIGGMREDRANAVAVDAAGSAYVAGQTRSSNFPVRFPFQPVKGGNSLNDAFVTKVAATGRFPVYSSYLGGAATDVANGIAADSSGTAYVAGYTDSANFPTVAPFEPSQQGVEDAFLTRVFEPGDTPGVVFQGSAPPAWFLRNTSSAGGADVVLSYGGTGGAVALAGDWNGDGVDTPGLYDPATGTFFLRNANTSGPANLVVSFGGPGRVPLVGDWDGDGVDTVGVYDPATSTFFLRNTNTSGPANAAFAYGGPLATYVPVAGDWDGDGVDTVGLYDSATGAWLLRNANSAGPADLVFSFGPGGVSLVPIPGDWNADGIDTPGLHDSATGAWFLRNASSSGPADLVFGFGAGGGRPIAGDWNG